MNVDISKEISKLLGMVAISDLPFTHSHEPKADDYFVTFLPTSSPSVNAQLKKTPVTDVYNYLMRRVFLVMVGKANEQDSFFGFAGLDRISSIISGLGSDDRELLFGRKLYIEFGDLVKDGNHIISDVFLPLFQYHYFENLNNEKQTMLFTYGDFSNDKDEDIVFALKPTMWESNLEDKTEVVSFTNQPVPNSTKRFKFTKESKATGNYGAFNRRDYIRIVSGTKGNLNADHDLGFTGSGRNNEVVDGRHLGDIDTCLKAMTDFLDDYETHSRPPKTYRGMVIITTSTKSTSELQLGAESNWNDSTSGGAFANKFIRAEARTTSVVNDGKNTLVLTKNQIPSHNHGTTRQNIMVHGSPEGSTFGGIAVSDKFTFSPKNRATSTYLPEDTDQPHNSIVRQFDGQTGEYTGSVNYDGKTAVGHENMPMYYKVRIMYKTTGN